MNLTAFQLDAFQTCAFQEEAAAGEFRVYGAPPSWIKKHERRILVEVDGNRFLVPESELHKWIQDKADEVIEKIAEAPKKKKKAKQQKQEKIPEIVTKVDDQWIQALVQQANDRVAEIIRLMREAEEEEDIEMLLLAA